jgi:5-methylcytosine-specific restriction endonuclease McrA
MPYKDKEKQKEYQRLWVANRRAEYFKDKFCIVCEGTEKLELDHIDSTTKISHSIWSWSEAKRLNELAKCQVLCNPCHKQKTLANDIHRTSHGTWQMYSKYKCRCVVCFEWKQNDNAKRYR